MHSIVGQMPSYRLDAFTNYGCIADNNCPISKFVFCKQGRSQTRDTLGKCPLRQLRRHLLVPKHRHDKGFAGSEDTCKSFPNRYRTIQKA